MEKFVQSKIIEEMLAKASKSKKSPKNSPNAHINHWGSSATSPTVKEINAKPIVRPLKLTVKRKGG